MLPTPVMRQPSKKECFEGRSLAQVHGRSIFGQIPERIENGHPAAIESIDKNPCCANDRLYGIRTTQDGTRDYAAQKSVAK